jgi:hypothetical protein
MDFGGMGLPMPGGEGADDFRRMLLNGLLAGFRQKPDEEFEEFGPLSETDKTEWASIRKAHEILVNKAKALEAEKEMNDARRKAFWAKLEADTGIFDKNMRITDDYRLLVEKDKEEKKEGCSGDCSNCSDSPDEPSPEDE